MIRRQTLGALVSPQRAGEAVTALSALSITLADCQPLVDRIWRLRDNLTACGAAYVALAEAFQTSLLTADTRLAKAPGITCQTITI